MTDSCLPAPPTHPEGAHQTWLGLRLGRPSFAEEQDAQQDELIRGLRDSGDPVALHLADKLDRCLGSRRLTRESWGRLPDLRTVLSKGRHPCEHFACWSCRRPMIRAYAAKQAERFDGADNHDCSLVTIADATTGDLSEIHGRMKAIRRALRDRRDETAKRCTRWAAVEIAGHAEPDPYWACDVPRLPPDQRTLIPALPALTHAQDGGVLWVLRLHLAIAHPGIAGRELGDELGRRWPGAGQVHVAAFHEDRTTYENAARVLAYGIKHAQRTDLGHASERWPLPWRVMYWTWLHAMRRRVQPLSVSVGPRKPT